MIKDRRAFLKAMLGSFAAVYAGHGFSGIPNLTRSLGSLNGELDYGVFATLVGQSFTATEDGLQNLNFIRLHLLAAETVFSSAENEQFFLLFQLDDARNLLNGLYRLDHVYAGSTQLYLQPCGTGLSTRYCRAEFNLLPSGWN